MASDRDPGPDDAALEAVWGREASATAPESPRPDLDALVGARPDPGAADASRRPLRRARLLVPVVLAVVAILVGGGVVVSRAGDDEARGPEPEPATTTVPATTTTVPPSPPVLWTAAITCPRFEVADGSGRVECPLATDDERTYVLDVVGAELTVRAFDAVGGQVRWEAGFPEGARTLERLPSVVAVSGVGLEGPDTWPSDRGATVALDPVTGERLWTRPGRVASAAGRDHLVLDHEVSGGGSTISAVSVVEATTGEEVLRRTGRSEDLSVQACGAAGFVLVSVGDRLSAHTVVDGRERWSVEAAHRDRDRPLACDDRRAALVERAELRVIDIGTGADIGAVAVPGADRPEPPGVLAVAGGTVVVGSFSATRGYRADGGLDLLWEHPCSRCGPRGATAGPAGDDVVVVLRGEAVVRSGTDGRPGPRLDLAGLDETVLEDGLLLARGPREVVVADTADLGRPARIAIEGVRTAAAGSARVVVATADEVRAYPLES